LFVDVRDARFVRQRKSPAKTPVIWRLSESVTLQMKSQPTRARRRDSSRESGCERGFRRARWRANHRRRVELQNGFGGRDARTNQFAPRPNIRHEMRLD
jgi:hypothetical protein